MKFVRYVIGKSNFENQIWSSTQRKSSVENAYSHWIKHKKEFPEIINSRQYVTEAMSFIKQPPKGTLIKKRLNGEKVYYNPRKNVILFENNKGVPKSMYKPDPSIHKYSTNLEYFYGQ